jgi:23S rRNA pseudouridine2605 synthase
LFAKTFFIFSPSLLSGALPYLRDMKKPRRFQRSQARNSGKPPGVLRKAEDLIGMRLNKYLAHSGVASRRQAGDLVKAGKVLVNGSVQDNPAYQIQEGDEVQYGGKVVEPDEQFVYILLNKPRNVITTTSDELDRTTVMDLLKDPELDNYRLFPVGRLDRDTTGLLLITNDGDVAKRLTHPRHEVSKIYHATLDKKFSVTDLAQMEVGYDLEDGPFKVDWVRPASPEDDQTIALQIHVGRNRIVRRAFEHLGYTVEKLDRVYLAGLTKKNLPRGFYRFLTEEEVRMIRHFS